jgi:xanthine dehydrogenase accessory factor
VNELAAILAFAEQTRPRALALASVVSVRGSAYRRPGARMLITDDGRSQGMISGGCLEGDVRERASQVMQDGNSLLVTYDSNSSEDIIFGLGLGCNGVVQVMIEPLDREDEHGLLAFLQACQNTAHPGRMGTVFAIKPAKDDCEGCASPCKDCDSAITRFKKVERTLCWPDGRVTSSILRPALKGTMNALLDENARRRVKMGESPLPGGDEASWLIETIVPPTRFYIFGAGDDAIPTATIAQHLGWQVVVVDARPAFANRCRFPDVAEVLSVRPEAFDPAQLKDAHAVVMTHSFEQDKAWLRVLVPSPLNHLSQIGPKARTRHLLDELQAGGAVFTEEQLARLCAPAGLDIGAETPVEVALSLVAGVQSVIAGHRGGFLKDREGPIHQPAE